MNEYDQTLVAEPLLIVDGEVERPLSLGFVDLLAFPQDDQVEDVSRFHAGRSGDAVTFAAILRTASPRSDANYVTLHADRDDFHVSVPLADLRDQGLVVYRSGARGLNPDRGGPIRFLIRDPKACRSSELDECANVKYLSRIELTIRKGRDTRPVDDEAHAALHREQERERTR